MFFKKTLKAAISYIILGSSIYLITLDTFQNPLYIITIILLTIFLYLWNYNLIKERPKARTKLTLKSLLKKTNR